MYYKIKLKNIEKNKNHAKPSLILFERYEKLIQRKITLKWSSDFELSSIDMIRILELLSNNELTQCVLACDPKKKSSEILSHFKDD